ncbi:MAG: hypothetical protein AAGA66_17265 [Bacteroidota bacterium]
MKTTHQILFFVVLFAFGCTSTSTQSEQAVAEEMLPDTVAAVCVWDNISVRSIPSSDGKWLTSISVGEAIKYLSIDSVEASKKKRVYSKVLLADGKVGWALKDFIVPNGKVAVFLAENVIYKRPDLLTKSDKSFDYMNIVAIKSSQDGWLEVVGRRGEDDWIMTGWVKDNNLSQDPIDVAVAKFGGKALAQKDEAKKVEMINEILNNADFSSSKFIPVLENLLDEVTEEPAMEEPAEPAELETNAEES